MNTTNFYATVTPTDIDDLDDARKRLEAINLEGVGFEGDDKPTDRFDIWGLAR